LSLISEELEQIAVDRSRNILYCLGKNGTIQVFDLGADGAQCSRVCVVTAGQIASEAHLLTQYGHEESTFTNITTICALEAEQSNQLNLVAITVKGVRIYFSVLARSVANLSQQEVRPQCLRVAHVRFSPGVAPTSIYLDTPQGVSVAYSDQSTVQFIYITMSGVCVMATANRHLVWALSDLYHPYKNIHCESMSDLQVAGNVWAITPVSDKALRYQPPEPGMIARVLPHPFFRQSIETKPRLLICTNEGIHEFDYVTPREALREALFEGGADGRATVDLWQHFGATETLVLALTILTSDVPIDERIKEKAASLFFAFKDAPELVDVEQMHETDSTWSPGDSILELKYKMRCAKFLTVRKPLASGGQGYQHSPSRKHDALYYYFSRLVSPIWNHPVCRVKNGVLVTSLSSQEMDWLSAELRKLSEVMDKYGLVPKADFTWENTSTGKMNCVYSIGIGFSVCEVSGVEEKTNIEFQFAMLIVLLVQASNLERQSIISLKKVIEFSAVSNVFFSLFVTVVNHGPDPRDPHLLEVLSLWSSANSFDLKAISASMDPTTLPALASRPFCHLICDAQHLNGDLIRAMISIIYRYFLGDEAGTKDLSERLRTLCPTLYSKDDACVTNAMEQLKLASQASSGEVRRNLIDRACELFQQSIEKVSLPIVCRTLIELSAFEQLADLCLLKAKRDDPKQLALMSYRHGRTAEDREVQTAEKRRAESYKWVTE
uniref:Nucleoporin_N domain-containing protein n=1 Tax=Angiostrongylus cantonensis TaxID=6313 RepID=A0A0K0CWC2_ANGCA